MNASPRACRICDASGSWGDFIAREMFIGTRAEFRYFRCPDCGCVQPVEIPADLSGFYPSGYYSFEPRKVSLPRGAVRFFRRLRSRAYLFAPSSWSFLMRYLGNRQPFFDWAHRIGIGLDSRILDVGCGSGELLALMHEAGFSDLTGVDPFLPADLDYAPGLRIKRGDLSAISGEFDFVMLNHSFEHMPNPSGSLRALKALLAPGGVLLIRVPLAEGAAWEKYRENWVQLDAPRHLFLHTVDSLRRLAAAGGYSIAEVVYDSHAMQFWGSEQYARDIPLLDKRSYFVSPEDSIFSEDQIWTFEMEAARLNEIGQGDQACFYLKPASPIDAHTPAASSSPE